MYSCVDAEGSCIRLGRVLKNRSFDLVFISAHSSFKPAYLPLVSTFAHLSTSTPHETVNTRTTLHRGPRKISGVPLCEPSLALLWHCCLSPHSLTLLPDNPRACDLVLARRHVSSLRALFAKLGHRQLHQRRHNVARYSLGSIGREGSEAKCIYSTAWEDPSR